MAKEKMVFFRSALGGFNRSDVNNYIENLNAEFAERERISKKKYEALEAKCADLESAKTELETALSRIAALEEEAAMREKLIGEYIEKIEAQKVQIEELEAYNVASESEVNELSARIESLSEAISKSEKYDDISAQIGEIILSAKHTAEDIVAKAEKDADAKRAAADREMENAAKSFNARAATAAYSVKNHIKKLAQDSYSHIAEQAAETSDMLRSLAAHISSANDYLSSKLSSGKTDAEAIIETEASKVFSEEHRLASEK